MSASAASAAPISAAEAKGALVRRGSAVQRKPVAKAMRKPSVWSSPWRKQE